MIQQTLMRIIDAIYGFTGNYGISIIILAVIIKIILYYPTQQQFKAMKDMQLIQPEIKKLQEKYKDNPKRLQAEQLELFKKHKVNPLGGCLPLLIQMPILWAIWKTIMAYKDVFKKAYFLWINPALHSKFPKIVAVSLGEQDIPMLILYGLSMYLSQKLTVTDPATAKKQSMMNLMMPIFFTYLMWMWKFPAALILYWLAFNILSIFQQIIIMKEPSKISEVTAKTTKVIINKEVAKPSKGKGGK